jgi:hypothetical protein
MMRAFSFIAALAAAALAAAAPAAAQESNFIPLASADAAAAPGWSFTPSLSYSAAWDDNVLMRGLGDETPADFVNFVNPRGALDYNGRRGQLAAHYDGGFALYRDLTSLNSYDQRGSLYARRFLTPHVALFVRNSIASVPTTELVSFVAVPFLRTGSRLEDFRGGVEAALSKHTSVTASYNFQWVDFDHSVP